MRKNNASNVMIYYKKIRGFQNAEEKRQFIKKVKGLRKKGIGGMDSLEVLRRMRGYED